MKKVSFCIILLFVLFVPFFVSATDTNQLIPINTSAIVKTEKFTYNNFYYNSDTGYLVFTSIQNNTLSKIPISINLLLFDQNQKNIGFVSYCTDKDLGGEYYGVKLGGTQSIAFSLAVTSRYFVSGKGNNDLAYIAVMDENKYCQISDSSKYAGLTISEIQKTSQPEVSPLKKFFLFLHEKGLEKNLFYVFVAISLFVIGGIIINTLHQKMCGKATFLAYLPATNFYVCAKMAFGVLVASIYMVFILISLLLYYLGVFVPLFIVFIMAAISFIIAFYKVITKKYDLFVFEPSLKRDNTYHEENVSLKKVKKEKKKGNEKKKSLFGHEKKSDIEKETPSIPVSEQPLDLSYQDAPNSQENSNLGQNPVQEALPTDSSDIPLDLSYSDVSVPSQYEIPTEPVTQPVTEPVSRETEVDLNLDDDDDESNFDDDMGDF